MKKTVSYETIDVSKLVNAEYDIGEAMSKGLSSLFDNDIDKISEEDFIKGKIRINIEWLSEDDCDCTGFSHVQGCPNESTEIPY